MSHKKNIYQKYMKLALKEAEDGISKGEQPYGAVILSGDKVISKAHSKVHSSKDQSNHAEIVAFDNCPKDKLKNSSGLTLVSTCEPCTKCFGLAVSKGVKTFVFGSKIETAIKYGSGDVPIKIKEFKDLYGLTIVDGVMEEENNSLLSEFHNKQIAKKIVTFSEGNEKEKYWMEKALEVGKKGMLEKHELPIGVILVAGDEIIAESSTMTYTKNSPITHGDFMAILATERKVYEKDLARPLVLYSTLEPHLLGFGAAIKAKVDKVVFGLEAHSDGGSIYLPDMVGLREYIPQVVGGVHREKQYELLKEFLATHDKNRVGCDYAANLVKWYKKGRKGWEGMKSE